MRYSVPYHPVRRTRMMNLWQHPTKPETRVYLNGMPSQPDSAKLWVEHSPGATPDWRVKLALNLMKGAEALVSTATDEVRRRVGQHCTYEQIVTHAKKKID